ncbi:TRAP transporter small permease [Loktanella sp. SALINAS62]|uniref:TRAP transporter small permease subunit n=1 Tax=Loktanella sp. SALINAS62 TaxID=2706124 RepID=UPI001B8CC256|nr:TRAP transporter small permease [Loktanella sp. SALINAS62]MBS1302629.1 TRAP transporter small permease [Loktanella sp. SALINAS62]
MSREPLAKGVADTRLSATSEGVGLTAPEAGRFGIVIERIGYVFATAIVLAALILIYEIFMRYVLNSPTQWVHETSIFLCAIAFLYGGLFCASRNSHIRVVLIYDVLPPRLRRAFDVVIYLVSAVSALFFAYAAWLVVRLAFWTPTGAFRMETSGSAWNPPTPAILKGFLFVIMVGLAIQFLILAYNHARRTHSADGSKI